MTTRIATRYSAGVFIVFSEYCEIAGPAQALNASRFGDLFRENCLKKKTT
jgi:hypothetical protein